MSEDARTPRLFIVLAAATIVCGVSALATSWNLIPPTMTTALILLMLAAALSENFAMALPAYSVSLTYPLAMGAIVLGGPAAAGLVALVSSTNYREIKDRRPLSVLAFNLGQLLVITSLGGWTYVALGGQIMWSLDGGLEPLRLDAFPTILVPMIITAIVCALVNLVFTALGVSLMRGQSLRSMVEALAPFLPTQVAMGFVGYLLAQVCAISVMALPLFVFPLVVARQMYTRYSELKSVYADTVRSLVGALEAKDPYTKGHSERVADYAGQIGRGLGMDSRSCERLEYAALLHDLGKLALPQDLLTKPMALSDIEQCEMREHPLTGATMVGRIRPLSELASFVRAHHERFDGLGYPSGIAGDEIPLAARILAVADSYDAMTTTRAYRRAMEPETAFRELSSGGGSQFDPQIVDVFLGLVDATQDPLAPVAQGQTVSMSADGMGAQ